MYIFATLCVYYKHTYTHLILYTHIHLYSIPYMHIYTRIHIRQMTGMMLRKLGHVVIEAVNGTRSYLIYKPYITPL